MLVCDLQRPPQAPVVPSEHSTAPSHDTKWRFHCDAGGDNLALVKRVRCAVERLWRPQKEAQADAWSSCVARRDAKNQRNVGLRGRDGGEGSRSTELGAGLVGRGHSGDRYRARDVDIVANGIALTVDVHPLHGHTDRVLRRRGGNRKRVVLLETERRAMQESGGCVEAGVCVCMCVDDVVRDKMRARAEGWLVKGQFRKGRLVHVQSRYGISSDRYKVKTRDVK